MSKLIDKAKSAFQYAVVIVILACIVAFSYGGLVFAYSFAEWVRGQ